MLACQCAGFIEHKLGRDIIYISINFMDWRVVIAQLHSETEIVVAVVLLPRTLSSCTNTEPCREPKKKKITVYYCSSVMRQVLAKKANDTQLVFKVT